MPPTSSQPPVTNVMPGVKSQDLEEVCEHFLGFIPLNSWCLNKMHSLLVCV